MLKIPFTILIPIVLIVITGCKSTAYNRVVAFDSMNEIEVTYSKGNIEKLDSIYVLDIFISSLDNQRPEVTELLLKNGIGERLPEYNLSQIACGRAIPGIVEAVQKYRPSEQVNYSQCLRDQVDKFALFLKSDMLSMNAEEGQNFIDLHYQEDLITDVELPFPWDSLIKCRREMTSCDHYPRQWNRKVSDTFVWLPRIYLTQDNKNQYLTSILQETLEKGAELNTIEFGVMNPKRIDNRPIQFHPSKLSPSMQEFLLKVGYDPNFQYKCNNTDSPRLKYMRDSIYKFYSEKETAQKIYNEYLGDCSLITDLLNNFKQAVIEKRNSDDLPKAETEAMIQLVTQYGFDVDKPIKHSIPVSRKVISSSNIGGYENYFEVVTLRPLHLAAIYGSSNLYEALLKAGADPSLLDSRGIAPVKYANYFKDFHHNRRRTQQQMASRNKDLSGSDLFGKAMAIGLGAAAISSLDVSPDVASQALGALATDVVTDGEAGALNTFYQQASKSNAKSHNSFERANHAKTQNDRQKSVDCIHEYNRAEMYLRNNGYFNFGNCSGNLSECSSKRAIERRGAINNELRTRGVPQCQQSIKTTQKSQQKKSYSGSIIER